MPGSLRIYLGAAPGVGKTFAMLNEGWRGHQRGKDVVIGWLETHGRVHTAEQVRDLERVPAKVLTHRGVEMTEMDVDAILARRPAIALVDELAHTNVDGSRHAKRWQDVEALLAAGIDVISTVNIQHLESVNDVVEQITGVRQRETVPDAVVRAADGLELVDMSPEALRRRLAHGNVYPADRVDAALGNYFREGNLTALRELALLWVADRVDESLKGYRARHGIEAPWETRERVAVALTGAPGGDRLVRRAARIAGRGSLALVGIHVRTADGLVGGGADDLARHRQLLEDLGGTYREVVGNDVAATLVRTSRAENATQLVLGATRSGRWQEWLRPSVVSQVVREAGDQLDVHVIAAAVDGPRPPLPPGRPGLVVVPRRRRVAGYLSGVIGLPLVAAGLVPLRDDLEFATFPLAFLLAVLGVSALGGTGPGLVAAVLGFALTNWFFAPPLHTLTISNPRDLISLVAFVVVAAVVSVLVDQAARRGVEARRARAEAQALASSAGALLSEQDPVPPLLIDLRRILGLSWVAVELRGTDGEFVAVESSGALDPSMPTWQVSMPPDGRLSVAAPDLALPDREVLEALASQLGIALERRRLQAEAASAAALSRTDELRSALLAAVSHDLRTPLAAIRAASSSLLAPDVEFPPEAERELLTTVDAEAERLDRLVGTLLDMSRIASGAVVVHLAPTSVDDAVAGALAGVPDRGRVIRLRLPETVPPAQADLVLLERVIANLVDNAVGHSPDGAPVDVEAGAVGHEVHLRVVDRGVGIPPTERQRIFEPFERLDAPERSGVGLGLAVARGFVEAMGGRLFVDDTPGGGTTMVVALPAAGPA